MRRISLEFLWRRAAFAWGRSVPQAMLLAGLLTAPVAQGDSAGAYPETPWGYGTPAARRVVCHSLEEGGPFRVAPNLWIIVDAEIARDSDWYAYSPALIEKGGVWTPDELDRFLEHAGAFTPGSTRSIRVDDAQERRDIIEFLTTLHN